MSLHERKPRRSSTGAHLGIDQPAVVQGDVQQIKHNAFWGVLKDSHPGELDVDVQTRLQLVQHCHGVAHVLGEKETDFCSNGETSNRTVGFPTSGDCKLIRPHAHC